MIISQTDDLKKLVNEFSNFARLPQSRPVLANLNRVIDDVVELYRIAHREVVVKYDQDAALPDFKFDPDQIKRVLMNLLDNAVAAVATQSEPRVAIRTQYDNLLKLVRVSVLDNGVGIPDSDRDRVFEPYFSTKENGTGLGLSIVRRIVEDHNGFIRALANEQHGTKLIIELPVAELDTAPMVRLPVETLNLDGPNGDNTNEPRPGTRNS